ncbi:MAG: transposase [Elusimicrobia bacterium]|nr:transposase [Elusimicrobiota bacterium]
MGRKPRIHFAGAIYHAYSRGVDRRAIVMDDADRRAFINMMHRRVKGGGAVLVGYCLMGNHFHLAIQVGTTPLSSVMQRLLTGYCKYFNAKYNRTGHLFEARHNANICLDERYLAALIHYIHMNPVRAGLVARPQDWPWSSYDARKDAAVDLRDFDPWKTAADLELPLLRKDAGSPRPIASIGADVSLRTGVSVERIRSGDRRRPAIEARMLVAEESVQNGHPMVRVAEWLHVAPCTLSRYSLKSYAKNDRPDTIVTGK